MPVNKHLQWFEVTDFTVGLWDERAASQLVAPNNALVICNDFVPLKTGGLRAFYKATAVGVGGIAGIGTKLCTGVAAFQVTTRAGRTGGGTESFDALLTTFDTSDLKHRIHRMDQSNDETTWKLVNTSTAGTQATHRGTHFEKFTRTDGTIVYLLSMNASGAQDGLWSVGYTSGVAGTPPDNVATFLQTWFGPIAISQARVLIGGGTDSVIHYSDVGNTTFTAPLTQLLSITPNRSGSGVMIISGIEPDDLLIGKDLGPWVEINGDISSASTPVREMQHTHHTRRHRQQAPRVPGGIAFLEDTNRVFVTDGRTFNDISQPIPRFDTNTGNMLGYGQMAFLNDYLFCPLGYVYDFSTGAWFKTTALSGNARYHWANDAEVWMADSTTSFDVKRMTVMEGASNSGNRVSAGTIRTVPFSGPDGRAVELREIQLFANTYSATSLVVKIIDAGGNIVYTSPSLAMTLGRGMTQILIPNQQDEYISVDFAFTVDNGTTEAPTIERIRYGFGAGNMAR